MSWNVIVPTNRPESWRDFLLAWDDLFQKHQPVVRVICDAPSWEEFHFNAPPGVTVVYYDWNHFPDFIPRGTDMCRSLGIYESWKAGSTYTMTLDDDVRPLEGVDIFDEYESVFEEGAVSSPYFSVGGLTSYHGEMRAFPESDRDRVCVAIQYGGWHGILDYGAKEQIRGVSQNETFAPVVLPVPVGAAVTTCAMNAAWRTEYAPIMWQLPLLDGKYNRFGDIWSGLFQKRVLDALGDVMVINGKASVLHERASDPLVNLEKEKPGLPINEEIWQWLYDEDDVNYEGESMIDLYRMFTTRVSGGFAEHDPFDGYDEYFLSCRDQWLKLFD